MDRLEAMSLLLTAVEAGSLSAAARQLNRPLSTISRRVGELETHLGVRLVTRVGRMLEPTEAGAAYIAAARRILDDVDAAERSAVGEYLEARGELTVTAPIVFGRLHVLPIVNAFLESHPAVNVRLVQADHVLHLLDERIDVAVRIGSLPDSALVASRVGEVRRVVCASPSYLASRGIPETPEALAEHDAVGFDQLDGHGWDFGEQTTQRRVVPRTRLRTDTAEAAIDAAIAGVGVTRLLSYQVADALRSGALSIVLEPYETAALPVSLVHGPRGPMPLKVRAFLDFTRPQLEAALGNRLVV